MHRISLLTLAVVVSGAAAAPGPKESKPTPITAENAAQVRAAFEAPLVANRVLRGHKPGALILFDGKGPAEVVDDATLKPVRTLNKDRSPTDLAVSRDGKLIAWTERNATSYTVQDTETGKTFAIEIGDHPGRAKFSPDNQLLAIGYTFWDPTAEGVGHSEVRLFDVTGKHLRTFDKTGPGAVHPVFSPDGKILAVGNRNHLTQLFDVATGKLLHKLDKKMIQEIAFSPDGKTLAAGYVEGEVALWDVATGKLLHSAPSGCKEIYSVDWSPKGDVLATAGRDGNIILWDPVTFAKLKELEAQFWVAQVRFTADGARLLTSGAADHGATVQRKITVWAVGGK